jgi:hypothetical protein
VGGPPLPSTFRQFAGAPFDLRSFFLEANHHPENLPHAIEQMQARFSSANKPQSQSPAPNNTK